MLYLLEKIAICWSMNLAMTKTLNKFLESKFRVRVFHKIFPDALIETYLAMLFMFLDLKISKLPNRWIIVGKWKKLVFHIVIQFWCANPSMMEFCWQAVLMIYVFGMWTFLKGSLSWRNFPFKKLSWLKIHFTGWNLMEISMNTTGLFLHFNLKEWTSSPKMKVRLSLKNKNNSNKTSNWKNKKLKFNT